MLVEAHLKVRLEQLLNLQPICQRMMPLRMSSISLEWLFGGIDMNFLDFPDGFKKLTIHGIYILMLVDPRSP